MKWVIRVTVSYFGLFLVAATPASAAAVEYTQIIRTRYEAVDQRTGVSFVIFSERKKTFYGPDLKLFCRARFVEVTQLAPTVGCTTLTFVEIRTVANNTSDFIHLTGSVRFRITGTALKSSNLSPGSELAP